MKKRVLSALLVFAMVLTMLPIAALAENFTLSWNGKGWISDKTIVTNAYALESAYDTENEQYTIFDGIDNAYMLEGTGFDATLAGKIINLKYAYGLDHTLTFGTIDLKTYATVDEISDQPYTGKAIQPVITVKVGEVELTADTDYTVTYSSNTDVGTAKVTITGKGNYTGEVEKEFAITAVSISTATIAAISDQTYTGSEIKPKVTVTLGDTTLIEGTDFTVAYTNNIEIGEATVTVTGIGDYTGTKTATFKIVSGGSTSRPSSGGGSSSNKKDDLEAGTTVEKLEDGTVITTVVDEEGNVTVTIENPDGTVEIVTELVDGTEAETFISASGQYTVEVTIPAKVVDEANQKGESIELPIPEVPVESDSNSASVVTVNLPDGKSAKVLIPTEETGGGLVAVLVKADGTEVVIVNSIPTDAGLLVAMTGTTKVKVIDKSMSFSDVARSHWGREAIDFASARGIMTGMGNGGFAPETPTSRAMLMVMLARLSGYDTTPRAGEKWYDQGMNWAKAMNISDGSRPDANMTREEMVTMLWRAAGKPAPRGNGSAFGDAGSISSWAEQAVRWAYENGIVQGMGNNQFSPKTNATRAQMAQILMNFIKVQQG